MPRSQPGAPNVILRPALIGAQLALLLGCAGPVAEFSTIPAEEAAWQAMAPRLAGMPAAAIEHCAGPPRAAIPGPGGAVLVYRDQDLKNYCQVSLSVRDGRVLPEILAAAKLSGAGLIVVGTHGRTGLGRLLMGSIAEKLVRKSPVPVAVR